MRWMAWRPGGHQAGRVCAPSLSLLFLVTLLGTGPVVAVERPGNAPMMPGPDEFEAVAQSILEEPDAASPAIDETIDRVVAYAWSLPEEDWEVAPLAEALLMDPLAAFEWVRDHVRYEPYQGALRGPDGTLSARAGNSIDQALLLAALLDEMLVDVEFAFGELDDATVTRLIDAARAGPSKRVEGIDPGERLDVTGVGQRARRDFAILSMALTANGALDAGVDEAEARADARHHVWVRMPFGATTLDLDPTLPENQPGDRLAAVDSVAPDISDELRHSVHLQVVLEELDGSELLERVVLDEQLEAVDASEAKLFLLFQPDLSGYAGAIDAVLSGDEQWTPVLFRDGERIVGAPFSAGGSGVDLLGDETELPKPVSARLVASVTRPDGSTREAMHLLFDRRADQADDESPLAPADLRPLRIVEGVPAVLLSTTTILVSNGGANPRTLAYRQAQVLDFIAQVLVDEEESSLYAIPDRLWPYAVAGEGLIVASERVLVPAAGGEGHGYIPEPRVYVHTIATDPEDREDWVDTTDLMLDSVRVIPAEAGAATAPARVWYGTLQAALETELGERALAAIDLDAKSRSASLATSHALATAYEASELPYAAHPALLADAADGDIIVTSEDPGTALTWWAVDPASGETRAMLAPGWRGYRDVFDGLDPDRRYAIHDTYEHRQAMGDKRAIEKLYGSGNPVRESGVYPRRDLTPPKRYGLPPGKKFVPAKVPPTKLPEVTCSGNEYIILLNCVSKRATHQVVFLAVVKTILMEAITYKIIDNMLAE